MGGPGVQHAAFVDELRSWSDGVVADEVRRLARRLPHLTADDLQVIRHTLDELVEGALLVRVRALPERSAQLRQLFALDH